MAMRKCQNDDENNIIKKVKINMRKNLKKLMFFIYKKILRA